MDQGSEDDSEPEVPLRAVASRTHGARSNSEHALVVTSCTLDSDSEDDTPLATIAVSKPRGLFASVAPALTPTLAGNEESDSEDEVPLSVAAAAARATPRRFPAQRSNIPTSHYPTPSPTPSPVTAREPSRPVGSLQIRKGPAMSSVPMYVECSAKSADEGSDATGTAVIVCKTCRATFVDGASANRHRRVQHQNVAQVTIADASIPAGKVVIKVYRTKRGFVCARCAARNAYKAVPRSMRAFVRHLHSSGHTNLEIADNLNISPAAVRAVVENESIDNVDSDGEYVLDWNELDEDTQDQSSRPREADPQTINYTVKMEDAPEQEVELVNANSVSQTEEAQPDTRDGDEMDIDREPDAVLGVPTDEPWQPQRSQSHSPKPPLTEGSPIQGPDELDSEPDIIEVECLIELDPSEEFGGLQWPEDDVKMELVAQSQVNADEQDSQPDQSPPGDQVTPSTLVSSEQPMECLVDPIAAALSSLGEDKTLVASLFKKLGCITQQDFDALRRMPTPFVHNIFLLWLRHMDERIVPLQSILETALQPLPASSTPAAFDPSVEDQPAHLAVFNFLRSLRRPLVHHLHLLHAHGIIGPDELQELCRQDRGGGLELAFHAFVRKGLMSGFDFLIIWEGLEARAARLQLAPVVHYRAERPTSTSLQELASQSGQPAEPECTATKEGTSAKPYNLRVRGAVVLNFLQSLEPPLDHIFPKLHEFGIRTEVDLRACVQPDICDKVCTGLLASGVTILEWIVIIRGIKQSYQHGDTAATHAEFVTGLNSMTPAIGYMVDVFWGMGLRTMDDVNILSRFNQHLSCVRDRILALPASSAFLDWLLFKRALHFLRNDLDSSSIDDGTMDFLRALSRPLDKHSAVFAEVLCLDSIEEVDLLSTRPDRWNSVNIYMLNSAAALRPNLFAGLLPSGYPAPAHFLPTSRLRALLPLPLLACLGMGAAWPEECDEPNAAYIEWLSRGDWWNDANACGDAGPAGKNPDEGEVGGEE
ncbi:hypothetical protein EIP86_003603 [Pleurotus ostreatoroseus]|nr:hypothetical protein EIP86_003603 [Pleurotus ostreatoroseus]